MHRSFNSVGRCASQVLVPDTQPPIPTFVDNGPRHDGGDPIEGIIKDAQDFFFGDYFFIELAIGMSDESTRRLKRETQQFARQTRFSIEATWLDTLISSGIPEQLAKDVLALTLSVVRGFSVRMLIENDPEHFSRLLAVWRKIIRQHIEDSMPKQSRKRT